MVRVATVIKAALAVGALGAALVVGLVQCSSFDNQANTSPPNRYGSYLAGRQAAMDKDASNAAIYFDKALKFDPENPELLERALMSEVAEGDLDGAVQHAEELAKRVPSARTPHIVLGVRAMRDGGYAKAREEFGKVQGNAAAEIAARVGLSYAYTSEGNVTEAIAVIEKLAQTSGARAFALYHEGVVNDLSGRNAEALKQFEEANRLSESESLRILQAYAVSLARNGRLAEAKKAMQAYLVKAPNNPVVKSIVAKLDSGQVPDRVIANVKQGLAETLYGIASSVADDASIEIPVFYLQLALSLEPRHEFALSLLADRLESVQQWEKANEIYRRIPPTSPLYTNALQQTAQNLQRLEKPDDALATLRGALKGTTDDVEIYASIGDILRSQDKHMEAVDAYTSAIKLIGEPKERHWTIFYTRGISYEQAKKWDLAEADLKMALKLKPEQPLVMNYLAYSWVEQRMHVPEALEMLKRAVELRPEDGYIVDSLGWAYYQLGDYQRAIEYLEKAIAIEPGQATINDHLGDAYWRIGRKLEAKYQWQHAMTLKPEKKDEPLIARKIEVGLQDLPATGKTQAGSSPAPAASTQGTR